MTQENKLLLLKDLCMRLPYNVYVDRIGIPHKLIGVNSADKTVTINNKDYMPTTFFINASEIPVKPYLRRISSMTIEECEEYQKTCLFSASSFDYNGQKLNFIPTVDSLNWLLKHHFDFQDLIPKGLAIEVTEENNPYKN